MRTQAMTDDDLERRLRAWYRTEINEGETASLSLRRDVAAIPRSPSRLGRRFGRGRGRGITLFAAAALVLLGGAAAVGSGLLRLPSVVPPKPPPSFALVPTASPAASPSPVGAVRPGALIALIRTTDKPKGKCYEGPPCPIPRLWVVGSDGSGAHELFPDGVGNQGSPGLVARRDPPALLGRRQAVPDRRQRQRAQLVDTGCVAPCEGDSVAAFSSDGTKIVFVRNSTDASGYSGPAAIATMDLASGQVTVLSSTARDGGTSPHWSPDGTRIVFWRGRGQGHGRPGRPEEGCRVRRRCGWPEPPPDQPRDARRSIGRLVTGWLPDRLHVIRRRSSQDIYTVRPGRGRPAPVDDGRDLGPGDLDAGRADPLRPGSRLRTDRRCAELLDDGRRRHQGRRAQPGDDDRE